MFDNNSCEMSIPLTVSHQFIERVSVYRTFHRLDPRAQVLRPSGREGEQATTIG